MNAIDYPCKCACGIRYTDRQFPEHWAKALCPRCNYRDMGKKPPIDEHPRPMIIDLGTSSCI